LDFSVGQFVEEAGDEVLRGRPERIEVVIGPDQEEGARVVDFLFQPRHRCPHHLAGHAFGFIGELAFGNHTALDTNSARDLGCFALDGRLKPPTVTGEKSDPFLRRSDLSVEGLRHPLPIAVL
jgi:hypothetical protein